MAGQDSIAQGALLPGKDSSISHNQTYPWHQVRGQSCGERPPHTHTHTSALPHSVPSQRELCLLCTCYRFTSTHNSLQTLPERDLPFYIIGHRYTDTHTSLLPVYVVLLVYRVDGQHHLSHIELGHVLWETVLELTEQGQEVTAHIVVHHQVLQRQGYTVGYTVYTHPHTEYTQECVRVKLLPGSCRPGRHSVGL